MWPLTKKTKVDTSTSKTKQQALTHYPISRGDVFRSPTCSPIMIAGKFCICVECPRKDNCAVELLSRHTKDENGICQRSVRACSVRTVDKGDTPKCADFLVEELNDYLENKYLKRYHGNIQT